MLKLLKGFRKNKRLEEIIARIDSNMENNYKDEAQAALREFEDNLNEMIEQGRLDEKQNKEYGERLNEYKEKMKKYTHKDQKPYWTR